MAPPSGRIRLVIMNLAPTRWPSRRAVSSLTDPSSERFISLAASSWLLRSTTSTPRRTNALTSSSMIESEKMSLSESKATTDTVAPWGRFPPISFADCAIASHRESAEPPAPPAVPQEAIMTSANAAIVPTANAFFMFIPPFLLVDPTVLVPTTVSSTLLVV